ncbi:junE proto-oncogene, AP-1 transcription factor subunit [Trematomus bernacchii]|uniref:junE proto-oncogene, AP-1 transcription factor subunit n=1 Tax=Trematomus bernacchii TaxID=40690 RepID=UPI00146F308C|nr:junE proto-oncogene, AP-1 transcription factor subunit [Trematomus bernacchii]
MKANMETPFYHDDSPIVPLFSHIAEHERYSGNKMLISKKATSIMGSHHFPSSEATGGGNQHNLGLAGNSSLMTAGTPLVEINLLKMASSDLENLIIHSNQALVTTSPVSNSTNPFIYRNQATNEQEGFADGFVKALADLHKQNQLAGCGPMSPSSSSTVSLQASYQRNPMSGGDLPVYTNLSSYNLGQMTYPGGQMAYSSSGHSGNEAPQLHAQGLDAPQIVPEVSHPPADPASSPSLPPINLEKEERIKAERKKLCNRIAASKCRKRKLERITRLEDKVRVLKNQNSNLASTAAMLREQVAQLKQKVMSHVTNGCQIAVGSTPSKSGVCGGDLGIRTPAAKQMGNQEKVSK